MLPFLFSSFFQIEFLCQFYLFFCLICFVLHWWHELIENVHIRWHIFIPFWSALNLEYLKSSLHPQSASALWTVRYQASKTWLVFCFVLFLKKRRYFKSNETIQFSCFHFLTTVLTTLHLPIYIKNKQPTCIHHVCEPIRRWEWILFADLSGKKSGQKSLCGTSRQATWVETLTTHMASMCSSNTRLNIVETAVVNLFT